MGHSIEIFMGNYSTPRLKQSVEYCTIDNKIYFFSQPGVSIQLDDSKKFITEVCKLMDGKKTVGDIQNSLLSSFPNEIPYLEALFSALDNEYLLEDTTSNYTDKLTNYDLTRWSRNIEFFASYCKAGENKYSHQEKLKSIKVTILGLGGVGSNIAYNLAAMGVCNIKAVDFDVVELSNLNRQIIYNESDIGQLKSAIARKRISEFLPNANIDFSNVEISSSKDIENIIAGQDIVICAIDHPREKVIDWLNSACVNNNIPFLCGSLDSKLITYYSIIPGKTGCIECWKNDVDSSTLIFQKLIQNENFVSAHSPNLAIMPFISLVAGFVTTEFLKITTGISQAQSLGKLCTFDFTTSQTSVSESWKRNPKCSACSNN
jgi:molybdopterin/thiamine biosynthesis adenylyltransferase